MRIPYVDLARQTQIIETELLDACRDVLRSGQYVLGPAVCEFEEAFAKFCGTRFAVGVNSGTDALILTLRALGVGKGDEVITPPNSFVATASAIAMVGATPRFVDVASDLLIDPDKVEAAITERTRAILPVHLTGRPARMSALRQIADKHQLLLLEDAAQSVGARYAGRSVGAWGDAGCFSLHPLKTLGGAGDGGVITTDDENLVDALRKLRNLGLATRDNCVQWCSNSRLDSLQAALLTVKLRYLGAWTEARRVRAQRYREGLAGIEQLRCPEEGSDCYSVYHTFVIQAQKRDALQQYLAAKGIGTAIHYPIPIHQQTVARELAQGPFPSAEAQAQSILSLPVYPELTMAEQEEIISSIIDFYQETACAYPSATSTDNSQTSTHT